MLHVITGLEVGGAEMTMARLISRLRGEFAQRVIALTEMGPATSSIVAAGVPVDAIGMSGRIPRPWAIFALMHRIREFRPDVVQTWLYHADLLGGIAARIVGVRNVAWNIRNNDLSARKSKLRTRGVAKLCAWLSRSVPRRIVCCARSAMETHVRLGYDATRMEIIPNGFDMERYRPCLSAREEVRHRLGISKDAALVGLIARFDPQKDHETFFRAAGLLTRMHPGVQFVLAGRGVDSSNMEIQRWIREYALSDIVHLLGEQDDVQLIIAAVDLVASSSWGEAFPNVIGEAMACGVPCVATNAGDSAQIVGHTGRIVPRDDPLALAQAMEEVLSLTENERRALGEKARARIAEYFELSGMVKRYATLYRELASTKA